MDLSGSPFDRRRGCHLSIYPSLLHCYQGQLCGQELAIYLPFATKEVTEGRLETRALDREGKRKTGVFKGFYLTTYLLCCGLERGHKRPSRQVDDRRQWHADSLPFTLQVISLTPSPRKDPKIFYQIFLTNAYLRIYSKGKCSSNLKHQPNIKSLLI